MSQILATFRGNRLLARAARSSLWIVMAFGASQALRLASNLILTRILFPEAFGLMSLVTVFMVGLNMFSDVGLGPSIQQNRRGEEPAFLNTGWTIQVIRGAGLWLATVALAWPIATFYGEPMLAQLLPVAALSQVILGFNPTRIYTANRHLLVGRLTALDLLSQVVGLAVMVSVALATGSVWALVVGGLIGNLAKLALTHLFLPGHRDRFQWERPAARELVHFGKWIFLSTAMGFFLAQGDKVILGKYLTLQALGIYNIAFFLASFPMLLGQDLIGRILIPLYRACPPWDSRGNFLRLRRMRVFLTGAILSMLIVLAFAGGPLVALMYDARYQAAGAVVVLIACAQMLAVVGLTYDYVALAAGDSKRFCLVTSARGLLQVGGLLTGAHFYGLAGALAGQAAASVLSYPFIVWIARRHGAWDALHDAGYAAIALAAVAAALWLNQGPLGVLVQGAGF